MKSLYRALILVTTACGLHRAAFSAPPFSTPPPDGVMAVVRISPSQPLDLIPFHRGYVRGVALQVRWQDIEPIPGVPNWAPIDEAFTEARLNNKWVQLLVFAGFFSPPWALTGAQTDTFTIQYGPGQGNRALLPMPWDPVYRDNWYEFVRLLSERYSGDPQLRIISASGPTSVSVEATLPETKPELQQWIFDGYLPSRYLASWQEAFQKFGSYFPAQYISLSHGDGLPIDQRGWIDRANIISNSLNEESMGYSLLGSRFTFQSSALTGMPSYLETPAYSQVISYVNKSQTGFQDNSDCIDGFNAMGGSTPAIAMQNTLNNASSLNEFGHHVNYWQVQSADIDTTNNKIQTILNAGGEIFNLRSEW